MHIVEKHIPMPDSIEFMRCLWCKHFAQPNDLRFGMLGGICSSKVSIIVWDTLELDMAKTQRLECGCYVVQSYYKCDAFIFNSPTYKSTLHGC